MSLSLPATSTVILHHTVSMIKDNGCVEMTEDNYLNASEAARYLNIHRSRIYVLAETGRIGRKMAGYWVFTKEELDKYKTEEKSKGGRPKKNS